MGREGGPERVGGERRDKTAMRWRIKTGRERELERERKRGKKTIGFRMQVRFSTVQPVGAAALVC